MVSSMVLRHSFAYLAAKGIPALISSLSLIVFTRLLSPEAYGAYALVLAWVSLGNDVLFHWIRAGLMRYLPSETQGRPRLLATVLASFLLLNLLVGVLVLGVGAVSPREAWPLLLLGLGALWAHAWFDLHLEILRADLRPGRYGLMGSAKAILTLTVGIGLVLWRPGAESLLLGLILGLSLPQFLGSRSIWQGVQLRDADLAQLKRLARFGLPLVVSFSLAFVITTSDRLILGLFHGAGAAGTYAVAYDLPQQTLAVIISIATLAGYPLAVRALEDQGTGGAQGQLSQNLTALLGLAVPAAAGLILLTPNIAAVLVGPSFRPGLTAILPWIALSVLVGGIQTGYLDMAFHLTGRMSLQVWPALAGSLVNLGLNFWWIPRWEGQGAAAATLVAYWVAFGVSASLAQRQFPLPFPKGSVARVLAATALMCLALWPTLEARGPVALAGQIALGTVAYGAGAVIMNIGGVRKWVI